MHSTLSTSFENITIIRTNDGIPNEKMEENKHDSHDIDQPSSSAGSYENIQNKTHNSSIILKNTIRKIMIKLLPSCKLKTKLRGKQIKSRLSSNESLLRFYNNVTLQTLSKMSDDLGPNADDVLVSSSTNDVSLCDISANEEVEYSTIDSRENSLTDLPYDENSIFNDTLITDNSTLNDIKRLTAKAMDDIMKIIEKSLLILDDNKSVQINNIVITSQTDTRTLKNVRRPIEAVMKKLEVDIGNILQQNKQDDHVLTDMMMNLKQKLDGQISFHNSDFAVKRT